MKKIAFVGSGPGDPELLTLKAQRYLAQADVCIYAGSLVADVILAHLPATCEKHDSATLNLGETTLLLQKGIEENKNVVRLHSGEPALYGAIGEQIAELQKLGIDYEVIPGISSFQAAAAALRVELTCPEVSQTVVLTRSPGRTPMPGEENWAEQFNKHTTYCLFLSVHQFDKLAPQIAEKMGWDCPMAVVYHASRPDQKVLQGTIAEIKEILINEPIKKTAQILIGWALKGEAPRPSRLYAAEFAHEYRDAK